MAENYGVSLSIRGLKELDHFLSTLPANIHGNVLRGGMRAGLKVALKQAVDTAPVKTGRMKAAIRIGTKLYPNGQAVAYVRAGKMARNDYRHGYYARFLEGGAKSHTIRAKRAKLLRIGVAVVMHPGIRAQPFVGPALEQNVHQILSRTAEYIRNRLRTKHGLEVPEPLVPGDE